jgi:hypothetical protein
MVNIMILYICIFECIHTYIYISVEDTSTGENIPESSFSPSHDDEPLQDTPTGIIDRSNVPKVLDDDEEEEQPKPKPSKKLFEEDDD